MRKVTILGGGGVRTPLLIHGLAQARDVLEVSELRLFDSDPDRTEIIASLGRHIVRHGKGGFDIRVHRRLEDAAEGADFVINSVRVGGIAGRARDERVAIEHGIAGQETTGFGGAAMAFRTVPVVLDHARTVASVAPGAWFINFTNPAGLITQALTQNTPLRVVGICDTPSELFYRIAEGLREPLDQFHFHYAGLNHLGWIRSVLLRGEDITGRILDDPGLLRNLYPADLFDPELIQSLRLIPTEYLFFYYRRRKAYENQLRAGRSRGEELAQMNNNLLEELRGPDPLSVYRAYLLRRNASYFKLEAEAGSAFQTAAPDYDPFETATGYHRIAIDVIAGLVTDRGRDVVVNVPNGETIDDLETSDVVEVPCHIDRTGPHPHRIGHLPHAVRGLVESVKQYERRMIQAALANSRPLARLALLENPLIADWDLASGLASEL